MSALGTILIYDSNPSFERQHADFLRAQGFITFETDNLYRFLKYAEKLLPDLVLLRLPPELDDPNTFKQIEQSLCAHRCPTVYTNAAAHFSKPNSFHYYDFTAAQTDQEQIAALLRTEPASERLN